MIRIIVLGTLMSFDSTKYVINVCQDCFHSLFHAVLLHFSHVLMWRNLAAHYGKELRINFRLFFRGRFIHAYHFDDLFQCAILPFITSQNAPSSTTSLHIWCLEAKRLENPIYTFNETPFSSWYQEETRPIEKQHA